MNRIPIATLILLLAVASFLLAGIITKKISSAKHSNSEEDLNHLMALLNDAHRISTEWNLGSLCLTKSHPQGNRFLLSFELGQNDFEKIETILHYEQDGGWDVIHPDYSALPILAKEFAIHHKISQEDFFALAEERMTKNHPKWQFITNNSVKIICF